MPDAIGNSLATRHVVIPSEPSIPIVPIPRSHAPCKFFSAFSDLSVHRSFIVRDDTIVEERVPIDKTRS